MKTDQENMNEAHGEAASLRIKHSLEPMPDPIYGDLDTVVALQAEVAACRARINDLMQAVEDVAIGARMECGSCGDYKPCLCDKGAVEEEIK